jgi:hypothetical protein
MFQMISSGSALRLPRGHEECTGGVWEELTDIEPVDSLEASLKELWLETMKGMMSSNDFWVTILKLKGVASA